MIVLKNLSIKNEVLIWYEDYEYEFASYEVEPLTGWVSYADACVFVEKMQAEDSDVTVFDCPRSCWYNRVYSELIDPGKE